MGMSEGVSQVLNKVFAKLKSDNYRLAIILGIGLIALLIVIWLVAKQQPKPEVKK